MLVVLLSGDGLELWICIVWIQLVALSLTDALGMSLKLSQAHLYPLPPHPHTYTCEMGKRVMPTCWVVDKSE